MQRIALFLVALGLLAACSDIPAGPSAALPVYSVVDTPSLSFRFERPVPYRPQDAGPPERPTVQLQGRTLIVSGVFYVPSANFDLYDHMSLKAVRERHYQGTGPYDSTGTISISVHGGFGGGFAQVGGAQYRTHLYDVLPGRYRLAIELQGVVYEPGVLLDSVIEIP